MGKKIQILAFKLLGRRTAYRLGRALYLYARGDIPNDMTSNGEVLVQRGVLAAWKKESGQSLVIFDVGANVGSWSASLLRQAYELGITDQVNLFAFEPVPATARTLRRNLTQRYSLLKIEELGLSAITGKAKIYVSGENAGTNSLSDDSLTEKRELEISLTSVVDYCAARNVHHVHLLKSDTEGHDMEVIRGAMPLLREERISCLQFEYNHRWVFSRNFIKDVFMAVESEALPYKIVKLQSDRILVFGEWHPELDKFFEGNYALIHKDSLAWFPSRAANFDRFNTLSIT
jgi:FkbM family methyltransferase